RRGYAASQAWWGRSMPGNGFRRMRELDLDLHALALCAQQVLCTAPLIIAMGAVLERTTKRDPGFYLAKFFGLTGSSAEAMTRLFGRSSPTISTFALVFAMVTALVFSTSVAAVQQRAFELIWAVPRRIGIRPYLRQLTWAFSLGAYSAVVLLLGRWARMFAHDWGRSIQVSIMVVQAVLTFLFYWWSQRWLLGGRIAWRALLPGAICVGLGISLQFRLSRVIVPSQIAWQVRAYGLIGAVFVLSVWLMILSVVIFGGVLIGALITERRLERGRAADRESLPEQLPVTR
ncbi:MAG: YihY/virulence factor BrkB family protein, partial [Actinobacteria bacterium]|nr:YihY/virulence factor BrkB family protein [Actinomycetota bacterium]